MALLTGLKGLLEKLENKNAVYNANQIEQIETFLLEHKQSNVITHNTNNTNTNNTGIAGVASSVGLARVLVLTDEEITGIVNQLRGVIEPYHCNEVKLYDLEIMRNLDEKIINK